MPPRSPKATWALALCVALATSGSVDAKRRRAKPSTSIPGAPAAAETTETTNDDGEKRTPDPALANRAPGELVADAKSLYNELEYDRVIPLAEQVLANPKATITERLDAYLLQGSALAIVGNPIDAEKPFRFLLRGRPDFDLPPETPPKILSVFRKVQVEENAIRDQMAELERNRTVASIDIAPPALDELVGGIPIAFNIEVKDPRGAVKNTRVLYRRAGAPAYSSLPLTLIGRAWQGEIPGEWSENDDGFTFEYYVATVDADDTTLKTIGNAAAPLKTPVAAGTVAGAQPFYTSFWFWGLSGLAASALVVSTATTVGVAGFYASQPPQSDLGVVHID